MIWILFFPCILLTMLFCYLTNPIVCLFANEDGELPHILRYWQTWDDSLNPRCYATKMAPKCLQYDWDKHYIEYEIDTPELRAVGRNRYVAKCINNDFTLKERLQRYLCRVLWIYRNCAYGFAFWVFGNVVNTASAKETIFVQKTTGRELRIGWDTSKPVTNRPWWIKCDWKITNSMEWNVYLGWKWSKNKEANRRCMIANRIAIKFC